MSANPQHIGEPYCTRSREFLERARTGERLMVSGIKVCEACAKDMGFEFVKGALGQGKTPPWMQRLIYGNYSDHNGTGALTELLARQELTEPDMYPMDGNSHGD